jgi:uncharacterized membrane protein (GlpM family)
MKPTKVQRLRFEKIVLGLTYFGNVVGVGLFWYWLLYFGTQWHAEQTVTRKFMHLDVAITFVFWCLGAVFLFLTAIFAKRTKLQITRIALPVASWLLASFLLVNILPFTPKACFQSIAGGYLCEDLDKNFKLIVLLVSLGFPALLGFISNCRFPIPRTHHEC